MRTQHRRRISIFRSPKKRELQLSQETVRTLSSQELSLAVAGCPTGSNPTIAPPSGTLLC
jgi:hypothetical protein